MIVLRIFDASPQELRDAVLNVRARVFALDEPRRWSTALVLAVMVRSGRLVEWADWLVEPPTGSDISMTPATLEATERLFSTPTSAVLKEHEAQGVVQHMGQPSRIVVDPFFQRGRSTDAGEALCVVTPQRRKYDIPVLDSGWLWNSDSQADWPSSDDSAPEYKASGNFQQQQGVYCGWPADQLFAEGPDRAADIMATPRPECPHRQTVKRAVRARRSAKSPPNVADQWICEFNDNQCAMKEAGSPSVGGPRALVPDTAGSTRQLLTPDSFERILDDANAGNAPLPTMDDFALIVSYLHKGSGKALDFNRAHQLISPDHALLLFEHRSDV